MTTYVLLVNWTEKGVQQVKESPRRLDAAKKALRDMGGDFKSVFLTMGDYDLIIVCEAPDDAVAARLSSSARDARKCADTDFEGIS